MRHGEFEWRFRCFLLFWSDPYAQDTRHEPMTARVRDVRPKHYVRSDSLFGRIAGGCRSNDAERASSSYIEVVLAGTYPSRRKKQPSGSRHRSDTYLTSHHGQRARNLLDAIMNELEVAETDGRGKTSGRQGLRTTCGTRDLSPLIGYTYVNIMLRAVSPRLQAYG